MPSIVKIHELLKLPPKTGDLGIEIEMEADVLFPGHNPPGWFQTEDNSLKGIATELVTLQPILYEHVEASILEVKKWLEKSGVIINDSFRAGVHIHVNCLDLTIKQLLNFACAYYCLETVLTRFCGETREGNFFCLRLRDAEAPLFNLISAIEKRRLNVLNTDALRYSALNFKSLFKHGSLEFRGMGTRPDLSRIVEWAQILFKLRAYALQLENRSDITSEISFYGPEVWLQNILGRELTKLLVYPGFEKDVINDMRNVQELIYLEDE